MAKGRAGRTKKTAQKPLRASGQTHFLGIGINSYKHWPQLGNAVRDVKTIAEVLVKDYGVAHTTLLLDEEASRENILHAFENLADTLTDSQNLIIYYAGHGHLNQRRNRGYWVPVEAAPNRVDQLINNAVIKEYIGDIPTRHTLLISDACFSGSLFVRGERSGDLTTEELIQLPSRWAICSGRHDETVADGPKDGHSPFAKSILDVLQHTPRPAITTNFLYEQVREQTRSNYTQLPDGGPLQHVGHGRGEYVFVRTLDEAGIWAEAQQKHTIVAYQYYIESCPEGAHIAAANTAINTLEAKEEWNRLQGLADKTLPQVNSKSQQLFQFCQQYPRSPHYADALSLGKNMDAKRDYLQSYHSVFRLMELIEQETPYREQAVKRLEQLQKPKSKRVQFSKPKPKEQSLEQTVINERIKKILQKSAMILPLLLLLAWGVNWCSNNRAETTEENSKLATLQKAFESVDTTKVKELRAEYAQLPDKPQRNARMKQIDQWLTQVRDSIQQREVEETPEIEPDIVETQTNNTPKTNTSEQNDPKPTQQEGQQTTPPANTTKQPTTRPEKTVTSHTTEIDQNMVRVAGGTFTMGCQDGRDGDCQNDEKPTHEVTLSTFYISKYEVTQAQWRAVMDSDPPELNNKGCDQCPVDRVSWDDIQGFLRKLNGLTGKNYRLPTEAEWEFAARGGNQSRGYLYSGSNTIGQVAWYKENSGNKTQPVGRKTANELGLYDMSGNVYEWCSDRYGAYASIAQRNPRGAETGSYRVNRGGGCNGSPQHCRAANRNDGTPTYRGNVFGFRLARS